MFSGLVVPDELNKVGTPSEEVTAMEVSVSFDMRNPTPKP